MRTISIPLLALVMSTLASPPGHNSQRAKRELLARSKRRWVLSTIEVVEEDPGPYPKQIAQMFNDRIYQHNDHKYVISGMGVTEEPLGVFSIDEQSGEFFAHKPIDREKHAFFHIKFDILDINTGSTIDRELAFDVEIQDINDNAPTFLHPRMSVDVSENTPEGLLPVRVEVTDPDGVNTPNSTISLSVISQSPQLPKMDLHQIDDRLAQLTFKGCLDYDKVKTYEIILQAKDHGKPSLSSTAVITLNIIDSNSHPPTFKAKKYLGDIQEMVTRENVLRLSVEDKDTPKTPGWRAKYFFVKGNEENNYKIETDPETNEGILSVIKGKDFERTTMTTLQIRVENEEALYVCGDAATTSKGFWDTVNITMKVTDVNDPPDFEQYTVKVYEKEEQEPGRLLYTPKVLDVDSDISNIRFTKIEDAADWVTIDKKTGQVTTTKKMDRESPFVHDNIYKILLAAIDDGDPPATSTGTVLVHLLDVNDNKPKLINTSVTMCGNKFNKVMIAAKDLDSHPYSGPFTVSLKRDDATQLQRWKVDPSTGEEVGLVSLKTLANGKYTVPLLIEDQQGMSGEDTAVITVCDCQAGNVCHHKRLSTSLGAAAIGLIIAGLLLFLVLLFLLTCKCRNKFKHVSEVQPDEGHQTLIKYNQEGGGSECKTEPSLLLTRAKDVAMTFTNGQHPGTLQITQVAPIMTEYLDTYNAGLTLRNSDMTSLGQQSHRGMSKGHQWHTVHYNDNPIVCVQGGSLRSNNNISDQLNRRIHMMDRNHPEYQAHDYAYEGEGSRCQSLDELSFSNSGEDFHFLNDLGPQFGHLGCICNQMIGEKGTQLSQDKSG
ncbi:cadherin-like protein 26 isoform X1 [Entelurus aequoreus]|uniref:cadherin-like protein 26 isoform X1 n=1 Tax=Entelurus aequoreus TaxID=161455 RepID=UPI002B1D081B|nr:cadherin-like protein 26 isoform X1 [Entelurus aequoreus]XP_061908266.1 cadherin-like protein 26 isoform X1 [Entelurus aequoreus]